MAKQPHTSTVKHGGENKGQNIENKGQNNRDMGVVLGLVLCCSLFPGWGGGGGKQRTTGVLDMAQAQIMCKNTYKMERPDSRGTKWGRMGTDGKGGGGYPYNNSN